MTIGKAERTFELTSTVFASKVSVAILGYRPIIIIGAIKQADMKISRGLASKLN